LAVNTSDGQATVSPPADPQFSSFASTQPSGAAAADTVLLPDASGQGAARFVLGPAALTQAGIASAKAVDETGQWFVSLKLTPQGSVQWDILARQQFHAMVGVVENGKVISVPLVQPAQSTFASFSGELQIAAGFTESQAKALAASI
jgi:preprotein translocase subunit SecD